MNYQTALDHYKTALEPRVGQPMLPRESDSECRNGRWILRNTYGFLAYVTSSGVVLDFRFQRI